MARIEAPHRGYNGPGPGGAVFEDGVATVDDEGAINYYRSAGYTVDGEGPGGDEPDVPDPRQLEDNVLGTRLRDAAVDPEPTDFLAPINAGQDNPHGPAVISPEIHTSGPKGVRPGEVYVDDLGKQEAREQAYAEVVLGQQVDANEAVATEVPDLDARGDLGLSDPGSAGVGAGQATEEPDGSEGDAARGSEGVDAPDEDGDEEPADVAPAEAPVGDAGAGEAPAGPAPAAETQEMEAALPPADATGDGAPEGGEPVTETTPPVPDDSPTRPQTSDLKAEWVDYAVSQGAQPIEAESMTKAELIERYGA
jgi:hypothetical protein